MGANLEVDVSIEYLTFFLEDDAKLEDIKTVHIKYYLKYFFSFNIMNKNTNLCMQKYKKGELLTGEVKKILADILSEKVQQHQESRARITEDVVDAFMAVRELSFKTK